MSDTASLIADMVRAGVDPDIIGRTAAALAAREPVVMKDEQAERRREKDRERKRLRNSAESAVSAEVVPDPSPEKRSPTPPKTQTLSEVPLSPPSGALVPTPKSTRASRLAPDWRPSDATISQVRDETGASDADIERQIVKARDWSASAKNGAKTNHDAFFRNWMRSAAEDGKFGRAPPGSRNAVTIDADTGDVIHDRQSARQDRNYPDRRSYGAGSHSRQTAAFLAEFCREPER